MPLPLGDWKINSNGSEGKLSINEVKEGVLRGSLDVIPGSNMIIGFWDETSQELTFSPIGSEGKFDDSQVRPNFFKGYLFRTPAFASPGQDVIWTLAGFYQAVVAGGLSNLGDINSRRNIFGWLAQITEIT